MSIEVNGISPLPYDPVLKEAVAEIREILERKNLCAFITLVSKTHGEYAFHYADWTGIYTQHTKEGKEIRIKIVGSRSENPDIRESAKSMAENTASVIYTLRDMTGLCWLTMDKMVNELESTWDIVHSTPKLWHGDIH